MSSSVPVCTFLPFSLHKFSLYSTALGFPTFHTFRTASSLPKSCSQSRLLCQLALLKGHFLLQHRFNEVLALFTLWGNRDAASGEAGPAAVVQPSGEEEGPPRTDVTWVPGSTQGSPHLIPQLSQLLAFDSPQVRAEETEPHRE